MMLSVSCQNRFPTQDSLINAFYNLIEQLNVVWEQSLVKKKEMILALEQELDDQYITLKQQYDGIVDSYNNLYGQVLSIFSLISPYPLSAPLLPYTDVVSLKDSVGGCAKAIVTEYSTFLLQKFLSLINTVLPISFNVPIPFFGSVDIVRVFTEVNYRNSLKNQLTSDIDSAVLALGSPIKEIYNGEISDIKSEQIRVQEVWQYVFQLITEAGVGLLHAVLGSLITEFQEIWDSLGLPSLPALLTLDIETLITNTVNSIKSFYDPLISNLKSSYYNTLDDFNNGLATEADLEQAKLNLKDSIKNKGDAILNGVLDIGVFGVTLRSIVNLDTNSCVDSIEQNIGQVISQAKDWAYKYPLKVIMEWMDLVTSFFNAIGLSSIAQWLNFTFCDFLSLIGLPVN